MKTCSTCQEEFADKFSFCPVDGTPLNGFEARSVVAAGSAAINSTATPPPPSSPSVESEETLPAQESINDDFQSVEPELPSDAHAPVGEYHLTIIEDAGLIQRLMTELRRVGHESQLTWPEFKADPWGFTRRSVVAYSRLFWRFISQPNVAIGLTTGIVIVLFAAGAVYVKEHPCLFFPQRCAELLAQQQREQEMADQIIDIPQEQEEVEKGTAGTNKGNGGGSKPKQDKPGGGGGGGREEQKP
ncbi:MAG: hypothetical protein WBP93_18475, partial [Pyrinomonadaceae bacterium]